jgi:hypothetical protein
MRNAINNSKLIQRCPQCIKAILRVHTIGSWRTPDPKTFTPRLRAKVPLRTRKDDSLTKLGPQDVEPRQADLIQRLPCIHKNSMKYCKMMQDQHRSKRSCHDSVPDDDPTGAENGQILECRSILPKTQRVAKGRRILVLNLSRAS